MTTPPLKPPSSTCTVCTQLPGMASGPGAARDDTLPDTQSGASDADEFPLTQQPDAAADPTPPNLTAELRRRRTGHGLTYAAMTLPIFFPTKTLKDGSPRDAYHTMADTLPPTFPSPTTSTVPRMANSSPPTTSSSTPGPPGSTLWTHRERGRWSMVSSSETHTACGLRAACSHATTTSRTSAMGR